MPRRFSYTLNNYTADDLQTILLIPCEYHIIGKEIGTVMGTPHLQGYITFKSDKTLSAVKLYFKKYLNHDKTHFEKSQGDTYTNIAYCSKDLNLLGITGVYDTYKGKRTDYLDLKSNIRLAIEDKKSVEEIQLEYAENQQQLMFVKNIYSIVKTLEVKEYITDTYGNVQLRDYQQIIMDTLFKQDDRQILFILDRKGNIGKSYLAKHIYAKSPDTTFLSTGGKTSDLAHAFDNQTTAIFDIPRKGVIPYEFLENLKSQFFSSNKYDSTFKFVKPVKIAVFTNNEIDFYSLIQDRIILLDIDKKVNTSVKPLDIKGFTYIPLKEYQQFTDERFF